MHPRVETMTGKVTPCEGLWSEGEDPTCEAPCFSQEEGTPGHQEEQACLQQLELP